MPDPLTPVTHVSVFSGIATSIVFRLCSLAPISRMLLPRALPPRHGHRNRQLLPQVLGRQRTGLLHEPLERPREHDLPALLACAEAQIDDVIGDGDHVGVVLDHEHRVPLVAQLPQDGDEPLVVPRVQADRRFVQHVQRADQCRPERGGEIDPLRLAARQRRRQAVQRQVVETDVAQERQAPPDLLQDLVGNRRFPLAQLQAAEERLGFAHRQRGGGVDRPARHLHVTRLAPQPRAPALGAGQIPTVPAQEHPDVHFVLLPLEPPEEAPDPLVLLAVAVDDERPVGRRHVLPRDVQADPPLPGRPLQFREVRAVVRLRPGLDGPLLHRLRLIRHDQIQVQLDDVAEAVAGRAGAERVVEGEQPRLRILVLDAAAPALEPLAEDVPERLAASLRSGMTAFRPGASSFGCGQFQRKGRPAALLVGRLDRIGEPRQVFPIHLDPVDDDLQRRLAGQRLRIDVLERQRLRVDQQAPETLPAQHVDRGADGGGRHPRRRCGPVRRRVGSLLVRLALSAVGVGFEFGRRLDHRHIEPEQQPRAFRQGGQSVRHDLGCLAHDLLAAVAAEGAADARPEQPHVVVELGGRADRRPGVPNRVLLADGDGRADVLDPVDVRLLHPLQELAGVGRQRLDVPPLPLRIDGIEGQRGLPRSADARDNDELANGNRDVDVLQIMSTGALDDDFRRLGRERFGHLPRALCSEFLSMLNTPS